MGPFHRFARLQVESADVQHIDSRRVVIAQQTDEFGLSFQQLDAFVGVGSISYHIAQAPHGVYFSRVLDDGFEGRKI